MKTKFYEFSQNNSGGSFETDDKVCHRLFIEAESESQAESIAESFGCYWDGVRKGMDCSCCGDRWYSGSEVDLDNINNRWGGYEYSVWLSNKSKDEVLEKIKSKFPDAKWSDELHVEQKYNSERVTGKMLIDNIEQYAQVMADLHGGWTTPECRIFYKDGTVKEIFNDK
jgi:hypothetical protein